MLPELQGFPAQEESEAGPSQPAWSIPILISLGNTWSGQCTANLGLPTGRSCPALDWESGLLC